MARVLSKTGWSKTQNNNNMKTSNKPRTLFATGLLVALLMVVPAVSRAGTCGDPQRTAGNSQATITDDKDQDLATPYPVFAEDLVLVKNITIQFYDTNLELVYSDTVCPQDYDCDERLNQLINQSDFITEVDGTMIFILHH